MFIQSIGHQDCWASCLKSRALRVSLKVLGVGIAPALHPLCLGTPHCCSVPCWGITWIYSHAFPSALVLLVYTVFFKAQSPLPKSFLSSLKFNCLPRGASPQSSSLLKGFSLCGCVVNPRDP